MTNKKSLVRVTVSLDSEDYAALGKLSEETDVSRSRLIRQAIRDLLHKYGDRGEHELALTLVRKKEG